MSEQTRTVDPRTLGEISSELLENASTLVRQEVELAKAELRQSAVKGGKAAGLMGTAGVAGHFALLFASLALWWALAVELGGPNVPALGWSGLILAAAYAIVAAILTSMGRNKLKEVRGLPRTAETLKKIPDAVKGNEEMNQ